MDKFTRLRAVVMAKLAFESERFNELNDRHPELDASDRDWHVRYETRKQVLYEVLAQINVIEGKRTDTWSEDRGYVVARYSEASAYRNKGKWFVATSLNAVAPIGAGKTQGDAWTRARAYLDGKGV